MKTIAATLLLAAAAGCTIHGQGTLYVEPSINRPAVRVLKVAIVPNRLPATLMEPERWRKINWGIVAGLLRERGFEIVDYERTGTTAPSRMRTSAP